MFLSTQQDWEMDRGLKRSSSNAENLTFGDCVERGLVPGIGVSVSALNTSKDFSNGVSGSDAQRNLSMADPSLMGRDIQEPDAKIFKPFRMQHQQKVKESLNAGENFSLLDESIADLNRDSGIQASDTFTMKMEEFSPMEKDRLDFSPYGHPGKEMDGNERVIGDNTIDILQDLDLPDSLSDLNEFYVADEAAFLSSLAVDDALLRESNLLKETSPVVTGNSAACANVNGTGKRQQMVEASVNMPVIKTEKDPDFIQLCTPGVIKQENERQSYCQMSGMGTSRWAHRFGRYGWTGIPLWSQRRLSCEFTRSETSFWHVSSRPTHLKWRLGSRKWIWRSVWDAESQWDSTSVHLSVQQVGTTLKKWWSWMMKMINGE